MGTINDVQGPLSQLIVSFFKERFPALSADPAMTALFIGLVIGVLGTWFIYWGIHRGITNGLKGRNGILEQENRFLRLKEQSQQTELRKSETSPRAEVKSSSLQKEIETAFSNKTKTRDYSNAISIEHQQDNPDFYWQSALMRGVHEPVGQMLRRKPEDPDPEGYHYIQKNCKIRIANNTEETIPDVVVRIEEMFPREAGVSLPVQLRFTDETATSIDLRPHEARFVDVVYWRFPKGHTSDAEWDYQFFLCGVNKDIAIKQGPYQLKLVAYARSARAERMVAVEQPTDGTITMH